MPDRLQLVCNGSISEQADGTAICSEGWTTQIVSTPFDISQIDSVLATSFFVAGFVLYLTPWAAAWGYSQILSMINKRY